MNIQKKVEFHLKKGSLHTAMGIKQGKKIPASKLRTELAHAKATHNTKLEKKVVFAINARKFKHK